ncbi:DUF1206 domain-containing protein [Streptomyces sp. ISL-43]|uniref:DUF1206 domain-containing protein n=1 Tax=Streptomyces sp. ISL-43 TaxID=2819183 RepID=UPI001BEB8E68|nr:DUF1206 domain-containing protein [Streptomyces sp. ISL-43]MBT2449772.1 DUF1206 domain-containing protein [Streptomyces sp. ISL-43]
METGAASRGARAASPGGGVREVTARCGLVARGVLYVLIGLLAVRVAFGGGGKEADRQGALQELAGKPFGGVLIWAVGIGLVCMALWRLSEAVFGAAGPEGDKPLKRLASAGRFVFYGVVAYSVFTFSAGGGRSGDEQSRDVTAKAMDLPAGQWLVGAVGLGIGVAGVVIAVQAARRSFRKHLAMGGASARWRKAVDFLGVTGGLARGAVFAAAGGFAVYAALRYDPAQAKGLDDTLRSFTHTAAGPWLLVAVAVGLALFGLFSWALARWREV